MPEQPQKSIGYVSTALHHLSSMDLERLFACSQTNNKEKCISGILMFSEGNFFQILEGETNKIEKLYEKIKIDYRHHNLIKFIDKPSQTLHFTNYNCLFATAKKNHPSYEELCNFMELVEAESSKTYVKYKYLIHNFIK